MKKSKKTVYYRRKREGKTNYKKRLKLLLSNRSRLVVRKSLRNIVAQVIDYNQNGDKVIVSANSSQLSKIGWNFSCGNIPSAYLTGLLLGKMAKEKNITGLIVDAGMHKPTKGSRIYAVIKGVIDAGIRLPHTDDVLPNEDRISGKHIEDYANTLKNNKERYNKQFSSYMSSKSDPTSFSREFYLFKNKIIGGINEKSNRK